MASAGLDVNCNANRHQFASDVIVTFPLARGSDRAESELDDRPALGGGRRGSTMTERREMGALEHDVLSELWALGEPATPAVVLDALGTGLAYTTVMTILTRLWEKGLCHPQTQRPCLRNYSPAVTEAELTARGGRMRVMLAAASDQQAALSRFVGSLSAREARTLRTLLEGRRSPPGVVTCRTGR